MTYEEEKVPLESLDPGSQEPGYWHRFQQRVLTAAAPELARRRAAGQELTVSDVVLSWGRLLVPATVMAAAAAALMLAGPGPIPVTPDLGIEEALIGGLDGEPIPAVLTDAGTPDVDAFLVAIERH